MCDILPLLKRVVATGVLTMSDLEESVHGKFRMLKTKDGRSFFLPDDNAPLIWWDVSLLMGALDNFVGSTYRREVKWSQYPRIENSLCYVRYRCDESDMRWHSGKTELIATLTAFLETFENKEAEYE